MPCARRCPVETAGAVQRGDRLDRVCGICGVVSARGPRRPRSARRDVGDARAPRAGLGGHVRRRRRRARGAAARDHRPRAGRPADLERGRHLHRRPERRDLQLPRADAASSSAPATASRRARTPRCSSTRTSSGGSASRSGCAACSRSRSGTRRGGGSCSRATASGSSRSTTATSAASSSFASELDALPRGELDLDALEAFLAFNSIPAPLSIFREIRKLPAGHVLTWEDGRVALERYARPGPLPARHDADEAELVEECRARLRDSVRAHLVADVPVGVLLSGGVDSGALAALAARGERRSRCARSRSASRRRRSTSSPARARSRRGTGRGTASSCCGRTRRCSCRRSPTRSTSRSPTRRRCRRTSSRGSRPRTSRSRSPGEGGDELFGGYYTYVADLLARARRAAGRAGAAGGRAAAVLDAPGELRLQGEAVRARRAPAAARAAPRLEGDLLRRRARGADRAPPRLRIRSSLLPARFAETEGHELLTRLQDVDFGGYLVDDLLVKTDRASMAWSLETRVPFLDTVVANFALRRCRRGTRCAASRRSGCCGRRSSRCCRAEVVHGRKRGFSIPAAAWLRGELEPFARETLSPETLRRQGYLRPEAVDARARRARRGPRGPVAPALGAARVHALARAPRRGRHAAWHAQLARASRSATSRGVDERLDRHDGERPPARLPAARRAACARAATRSRSPRATTRRRCS